MWQKHFELKRQLANKILNVRVSPSCIHSISWALESLFQALMSVLQTPNQSEFNEKLIGGVEQGTQLLRRNTSVTCSNSNSGEFVMVRRRAGARSRCDVISVREHGPLQQGQRFMFVTFLLDIKKGASVSTTEVYISRSKGNPQRQPQTTLYSLFYKGTMRYSRPLV